MEHPFHYFTDVLSLTVGMSIYFRSRVKDGISEDQRTWIIVGALFGALVGSRLVAALEDPSLFFSFPGWMYYFGSKTIIGGIAGGIIGVEVTKKIFGITVRTGDRTIIPLAVAIIIGRIGCFFTGVADGTVGGPCDFFWCLDQGDGLMRHPNSLYEIVFLAFFLLVYVRYLAHARFFSESPGRAFRLFIASYFLFRIAIEFLKETHPLLFGFNSIQWAALLFVIWYGCDMTRAIMSRRNLDHVLVSAPEVHRSDVKPNMMRRSQNVI